MTSNPLKRPVPHINHSPELEAAAIAVTRAMGPKGLPVLLCPNPLDVHAVRASLGDVSRSFEDPAFWYEDEHQGAEMAAVENIILLANLLREHLKAGNTK